VALESVSKCLYIGSKCGVPSVTANYSSDQTTW